MNTIKLNYGKIQLEIKVGDLFSANTDVIVNPANKGLTHGGGLAAAISQAAGEVLDQESDNYIKKHGRLFTGDAVVTTAGRMDYKAVIHVVGPIMGDGNEQELLVKGITNAFKRCEENNWSSIALPAISTGIFSVPVETFGNALNKAIIGFAYEPNKLKLIKVYLSIDHFNIISPIFIEQERGNNSHSYTVFTEEISEVEIDEQDVEDIENLSLDDIFRDMK